MGGMQQPQEAGGPTAWGGGRGREGPREPAGSYLHQGLAHPGRVRRGEAEDVSGSAAERRVGDCRGPSRPPGRETLPWRQRRAGKGARAPPGRLLRAGRERAREARAVPPSFSSPPVSQALSVVLVPFLQGGAAPPAASPQLAPSSPRLRSLARSYSCSPPTPRLLSCGGPSISFCSYHLGVPQTPAFTGPTLPRKPSNRPLCNSRAVTPAPYPHPVETATGLKIKGLYTALRRFGET